MLEIKKYNNYFKIITAVKCCEPNEPEDIAKWCNGKVNSTHIGSGKLWIEIETTEGIATAYYGDYIIKRENGQFNPCKAIVFEMIYNPLN